MFPLSVFSREFSRHSGRVHSLHVSQGGQRFAKICPLPLLNALQHTYKFSKLKNADRDGNKTLALESQIKVCTHKEVYSHGVYGMLVYCNVGGNSTEYRRTHTGAANLCKNSRKPHKFSRDTSASEHPLQHLRPKYTHKVKKLPKTKLSTCIYLYIPLPTLRLSQPSQLHQEYYSQL